MLPHENMLLLCGPLYDLSQNLAFRFRIENSGVVAQIGNFPMNSATGHLYCSDESGST